MKSILILGLYFKNLHSACMGSLDTAAYHYTGKVLWCDGYGIAQCEESRVMQPGALEWHGYGLASALHQILQDAQPLRATALRVLCNHAQFVEAFTRPIRLALPDERPSAGSGNGRLLSLPKQKKIPCGNENQWDVARDLMRYECWQFLHTENMPKAKELWRKHYE